MQTKTKAGVWMLAMGVVGAGIFFAGSARAATTPTSVSPSEIWTDEDSTITISGSGFTGTSDVELFRITSYTPADEIRNKRLNFTVVSDNQITATVPSGLRAGSYEIWVNDATLESALTIQPTVTSNVTQLNYSVAKKAKQNIILEFKGIVLGKNNSWATIKFGGRSTKVKRVSVRGNNSTVVVELNYGKMAQGTYDLSLNYKNKVREEIDNGSKIKYRNRWDNGSANFSGVLQIL